MAEPGLSLGRRGLRLAQRLAQDVHAGLSRVERRFGAAWTDRAGLPTSAGGPDRRAAMLAAADASLATDILPFWTRHTWDAAHGGFLTHLDRHGERLGATDKHLVMQARMAWTLAAAHRHGLQDAGYLDLAGRGVDFLTGRMWDTEHGGFVWTVDRAGRPLDPRKVAYGQAFAIYALAEYALAARDVGVLEWAGRTLARLHERGGDGKLGFREAFSRDWVPVPDPEGNRKTLNTHLHLMEALGTLAQASGRATHAAAAGALLDLLLAKTIHPEYGCAMEGFDRRWRPEPRGRRITSYGENVELAWLALDAADTLGRPREPLRPAVQGLVDHALRYGFDRARGGLALYGPLVGHVTRAVYLSRYRLTKAWWPQAELLVATIELYRETGEARYRVAFEREFDWIWTHQADHAAGDWFEATTWDGRPLGFVKGHATKGPYHAARALMRTARALRALARAPALADPARR